MNLKDNMSICRWPGIFLLLILFACDKPLPTLEGMDLSRWKEDKNACGNIRISMWNAINREKKKLLSLDQMQIVSLLGKPDQNELLKRNQKFFFYFLDPAPICTASGDSAAKKLVIRFNAMGLAKEVAIE